MSPGGSDAWRKCWSSPSLCSPKSIASSAGCRGGCRRRDRGRQSLPSFGGPDRHESVPTSSSGSPRTKVQLKGPTNYHSEAGSVSQLHGRQVPSSRFGVCGSKVPRGASSSHRWAEGLFQGTDECRFTHREPTKSAAKKVRLQSTPISGCWRSSPSGPFGGGSGCPPQGVRQPSRLARNFFTRSGRCRLGGIGCNTIFSVPPPIGEFGARQVESSVGGSPQGVRQPARLVRNFLAEPGKGATCWYFAHFEIFAGPLGSNEFGSGGRPQAADLWACPGWVRLIAPCPQLSAFLELGHDRCLL